MATLPASAATYYVSPSGNDANNGASLTLAKQTIQAGINVATSGDTILVADGTYSPITISPGIIVRSVNGAQSTTINGGGVTRCAYLSANAVLDGFTVTGGSMMNGYSSDGYGGGVNVYGGTLQNCTISGNWAIWGGGGVNAVDGNLQNCTISGNSTYYYGGGVFAYNSTVVDCTISENSAGIGGGGVDLWACTVQNCTISGNSTYYYGGGMLVMSSLVENCTISRNSVTLNGGGAGVGQGSLMKYCTISENIAYRNGGGALIQNSTVENCTISSNTSYGSDWTFNYYDCGGGVYVLCGGTVRNSMLTGNIASWDGGGAFLWGGTMENCTLNGNYASSFGGGISIVAGTVVNCMISGNEATDMGGGAYVAGGTLENCTVSRNTVYTDNSIGVGGGVYVLGGTVWNCIAYYNQGEDVIGPISYSCIGTNIAGAGNITNEPQFVSTGTGYGSNLVPGNYRLRPTSPCINAGANQSWMITAVDLDGLPRIVGDVVDMGAYEFTTDPGTVQFDASSYNVNEGAGIATLTVTRTGGRFGPASVDYATADGTSSADSDYVSQSGTLSWSAGDSLSRTITISITDDSLDENDETFTVTLSNATGADLGSPSSATVTIVDNDDPPVGQDEADLEVSDLKFVPVNLWAGDHPAMISFDLVNEGPDDLVAPDAQLEITFYLSVNQTFGDEDDLAIGTKIEALNLPAGSQTTIRYPGRAHNEDVTIPEGLTGDYYVFVNVRLASSTGLSDPDGAYAMRDGPINVRIHPNDGGGDSRRRAVVSDYDGDEVSDITSYDEPSGEWAVRLSASGELVRFIFGGPGYETVAGDYDGDGKTDPAIHDRQGSTWSIMLSELDYQTVGFNFGGERKTRGIVGDYDGDSLADPGLYEEGSGCWSVLLSYAEDGNGGMASAVFGGSGYAPVAGDYDGDGKVDPAVYAEATGDWQVLLSVQGYGVVSAVFGGSGYTPVVGDYDGDGKADPMLFNQVTGEWTALMSGNGYAPKRFTSGAGDPIAGDFDGDGIADPAVLSGSAGWSFLSSASSYLRAGPYFLTSP
ncbi:MAG: hypothetical protein HYV36_03485 [Lentisphaerae bacterium]|nr:hypothetical protein [Lentisphaerota bacterium]